MGKVLLQETGARKKHKLLELGLRSITQVIRSRSNILNYDFGRYVLKQEGNFSLALVILGEVQQQEIFQRKFSGTCIFPVTQLYLRHNFKGKIMQPTGTHKELGTSYVPHCDFQSISPDYLQSQSVECTENWKVALDPATDRQPLLPANGLLKSPSISCLYISCLS